MKINKKRKTIKRKLQILLIKDNLRTVKEYLNEKLNKYTTKRFTPLCLEYILKKQN